ncbi:MULTISPECIES: hypothetical protein [unclassified Rhizobium]|uniref:hypothetical protein n=1 Tax=unclassified Rhizobium TaxID=2613769 RepID=UPI001AD95FC7|nr:MULTISPECIES: hypothetical protein [unclassified Rhizobium]MBO9127801.1 hypothetical protein [Rhizobium sp. 16-488-2b]MBO9178263.1 hypothetical protein [Rhizobium sp. 16-488-2a]
MNKLTIDLKAFATKADRPAAISRAWSGEELKRLEAEVVFGVVSRYGSLERARIKSRGGKKDRRSAAGGAGK